jgi:hypothetical protein
VNPCFECEKRAYLCIFDESSDKRRKYHAVMIEEELRYYKEFVGDVFMAMRTCSDADIQQIIDVVRSGSSTSEVQITVTNILAEDQYIQPTFLQKAPEWDQGN